MSQPPIVVVLGAGFSQSLGMPGTSELTKDIEKHFATRLKENTADLVAIKFQDLTSELRSEYGSDYSFEILFEALELSRQFSPEMSERSVLRRIADMKRSFGADGPRIFAQIMENAYFRLHMTLVERQQGLEQPAVGAAREFFQKVGQTFDIACINLNYDDCVETVAPYFYDGFDAASPGSLAKSFNWKNFLNNASNYKLAHLHGSVRFGLEEQRPSLMCSFPDVESTSHAYGWVPRKDGDVVSRMISGLRKGEKLLYPPYNYLYHWAAKALSESPRVIVVGYGVGDFHLNSWLALTAMEHGGDYRLAFVTKSIDSREDHHQSQLLGIAGGIEPASELGPFMQSLQFDQRGIAKRGGLCLIRTEVPPTGDVLGQILDFMSS